MPLGDGIIWETKLLCRQDLRGHGILCRQEIIMRNRNFKGILDRVGPQNPYREANDSLEIKFLVTQD